MTRASGRKTGPTPSGAIARLKANVIARYKLANVPGRPEELRQPGTTHAISIQYGAMQIRVRLMDGRTWVKSVDYQVERFPAWLPELFSILDPWFGVIAGVNGEPHDVRTFMDSGMAIDTQPGGIVVTWDNRGAQA